MRIFRQGGLPVSNKYLDKKQYPDTISKEESKDQESIQSSTTPEPRHEREVDKNTRKHHTQESQEVSPFPVGDYKAERNRHDGIIKQTRKHAQKKYRLGTVSKKITGGLKHV